MSVRKYIRHSDGNCERGIGFLDENESRYSSKFHHNSILHEPLQQGKWSGTRSVAVNNYNSSGGQKGDRANHMAYESKTFLKDTHPNESHKGKSFSRSPPSRQNSSSVSVFNHQKSHNRNSSDDFEWSQHVSSSGKVYYYNRRSERSQWEKPREWLEREQQRAKERYTSYKEGSRESRDSSRYSRSVSRRDGGKETSSYNKRDREMHDRDKHSKVIKTEGASTSAVSTITSRSSVGSTPDSGSPSCSSSGLQDISPPTTPTNVSMVSPYINTSTPGNVLSPHLYSCSPVGLQASSSLITQSSPSSNSYGLSQNLQIPAGTSVHNASSVQNPAVIHSPNIGIMYSSGSTHSPGTVHSSITHRSSGAFHSSTNTDLQQNLRLLNSNCADSASERVSPTPPLHPLQQATLLQKQQLAGGIISHKLTGAITAVGPNYLPRLVTCENSPPPPPPPHGVLKKQPLRQDSYENSNRNPELRTQLSQSRSSPLPHKHGLGMQDSMPNNKKYSRNIEPLIFPELKDIQVFSAFCSKEIYEDVAAWYGNVLDRQANGCWEEAMHSLTQEGCRTKANLILGNFVYDILDTRVEVINRKLACLRDVHNQVESLQDLRSGS